MKLEKLWLAPFVLALLTAGTIHGHEAAPEPVLVASTAKASHKGKDTTKDTTKDTSKDTKKDTTKDTSKKKKRRRGPKLHSQTYLVVDADSEEVILAKRDNKPRPIASLTKLLSAMVYLDMKPNLDETIELARDDRRGARPAKSRLRQGWKMTARDLLHGALMASENQAINALVRSTGLTRLEFVGLMNRKAQALGMTHSIFFDASGLDALNTATAHDVLKMLEAAAKYPLIAEITTMNDYTATILNNKRTIRFANSDRLARSGSSWDVVTGKTGYITDAGYCLAVTASKGSIGPLHMVFLGAPARLSRFGDAARVAAWLKKNPVEATEKGN